MSENKLIKKTQNLTSKENENNDYKKEDSKIVVFKQKQILPYINYKKQFIISTSFINYMAIGISLFIFGVTNLKWFEIEYNEEFYKGYYIISGIALYIIGIFDWYEGKELIFLIDFIYSFYFISLFLTENRIIKTKNNIENIKMHGTFYAILFSLIICIAISSKNKGKIYIIDYIVLFLGYLFLFFYKYIKTDWGEKVYAFIFIVAGGLFWITGLLKIIDNGLSESSIGLLQPSD